MVPVLRRKDTQIITKESTSVANQWIPCGRNMGFLDRSRYFLFRVAPQLYS
jgi:hypothetical protein